MTTKIEINVNGQCLNCPFMYTVYDDFAIKYPFTYYCSLAKHYNLEECIIDMEEAQEGGAPESLPCPDWCPLTNNEITVKQ